MNRKLLILVLLLLAIHLIPPAVSAQPSSPQIIIVTTSPSGACAPGLPLQYVLSTGHLWSCEAGTWTDISGGGGGGVSGSGTATHMTLWVGATQVGDSPATFASSLFTFPDALTVQAHSAFGVGSLINTATDPFSAGTFPIVVNINESPTGAVRTSGHFSTIDWEPTATVASASSQPFNQNWATVNLDGQNTANVQNLTLYNVVYSVGDTTPLDDLVASTSESYNEGNANVGHLWGGSFLGEQDGTGTVSGELIGVISNVNISAGNVGTAAAFFVDNAQLTGGTLGQWAGVNIGGPIIAGATVANAAGVLIGDIAGATNNFAIKTGLGKNEFGDVIQADNLTASELVQTNASKQLISTTTLPNGTTATTQTAGDNTTKVATDAFVIANASGGGSSYTNVPGSASQTTVAAINTLCGSGTLYATTPLSIATGGTVTCPVQFSKAGLWTIASGQTVTWGAGVTQTDAASQIFAGSGTVAFSLPQTIDIRWSGSTPYTTRAAATSGTDSTANIQALLAAAAPGSVFVDGGLCYRTTSPLSIATSNITWKGQGNGQWAGGSVYSSCLVVTSASADDIDIVPNTSNVRISGLAILRDRIPTGTATGISVIGPSFGVVLDNNQYQDQMRSTYASDTNNINITNSVSALGYQGFSETTGTYCSYCFDDTTGGNASAVVNNNLEYENSGVSATVRAISITGSTTVSDFHSTGIVAGEGAGGGKGPCFYLHSTTTTGFSAEDIVINDMTCTGVSGFAVDIDGINAPPSGVQFNGGFFTAALSGTLPTYLVSCHNSNGITFTGAKFNGFQSISVNTPSIALMHLDGCSYGSLTGNDFNWAGGGIGAPAGKAVVMNAGIQNSISGGTMVIGGTSGSTALTLTGSSNNSVMGVTFGGYGTGISADASSNHNHYINLNTFPSTMTPVSDAGTDNQFAAGGDTITSPGSTLTVGGTSTNTTLDFNLTHANTWTGQQTFVAPVLGTPASGLLTNATGLPAASVVSGSLVNGMAATTQTGGDNTTKLATTAFVQAAIAAAGTGAGIVTYSGPSLTFSGTQYFPIGGGGLASTTETNVDIDSPAAVTIQNMTVQMSAAPGIGNSVVYTWRKNASSQTLTCTISGASATSCSDTTHNFSTASLDLLDIQAVTTGTIVGTPTVVMAAQVGIAATATTAFSSISGGTNTTAAMVVGSGASLAPGGTGTVTANGLTGSPAITVSSCTGCGGGGPALPFSIVQEGTCSTVTGAPSSLTCTYPSTLAASGNTVFFFAAVDGSTTINCPSGWTSDINVPQASFARLLVCQKASDGTTSFTISFGGANEGAAYFAELSGARTFDQSSTGGIANQQFVTLPSITPTGNSMVFGLATIVGNSSGVWYSLLDPVFNPLWTNIYIGEPASAARTLVGHVYGQTAASGVAIQPPTLSFTNLGLFASGGIAFATFDIK